MECKHIREHLFTDYFDGEMKEANKLELEQHLTQCKECKEFACAVQKTVVAPTEQMKRFKAPERLWTNFKISIEEESRENVVSGFIAKVQDLIFSHKPAFVFGTFACLVFMVLVLSPGRKQDNLVKVNSAQIREIIQHQSKERKLNAAEQVEYVAYLFDETNSFEEYGTSIEEYFL